MGRPYVHRVNTGGNFCGHDPFNPRLLPPKIRIRTGKNGHPPVIGKLIERVLAYFDRPSLIPALDAANGKDRKTRSERRESCLLIIYVIANYLDLASMRIGKPVPTGFELKSINDIAALAGISYSRCKRAIRDLKAAGIIYIKQRYEVLENGKKSPLVATKSICKALFRWFGLESELERDREIAIKKLERKRIEWNKRYEETPAAVAARAAFRVRANQIVNNTLSDTPPKHKTDLDDYSEGPWNARIAALRRRKQ